MTELAPTLADRLRAIAPPALRYPKYRAYWFGTLASVCGFQMLMFAQGWLTYELTESPLALGIVSLASASTSIALNLFGGVFADRLDKRKLIFFCQLATASLIFLLGLLTFFEVVEVWHIVVLAFMSGAVNAFDQPARQALYPHLIERRVMMSAVALNSVVWQGTRIIAPAAAGLVVAMISTSAAIFIAGSGFVVMALVIIALRVPRIETYPQGSPLSDLMEGLSFIKSSPIFWFLIGMTFFNSFFGMAYITMMPAFAVDILRVGADGQGFLMMVGGVGASVVTLVFIWHNFRQKGLLIIGGGLSFGVSIATFALTSQFIGSYPLALALMIVMGVSSSTYMISIMSSLQLLVPDNMRGRVMGFYGMTWSIMPLGGFLAGVTAEFVGVPVAKVIIPEAVVAATDGTGAIAAFVGVPVTIAIGGGLVAAFALGPAFFNRQVRNIGEILSRAEVPAVTSVRGEGRAVRSERG